MRPSVVAGSFIALTQMFPRLRPALWRSWYNLLAAKDQEGQLLFMNYGYSDGKDEMALAIEDEPHRYLIQLYAHVVTNIDLGDKDVLEVGCGRGGGGSFYMRYLNPRSYIGVDLSDAAIVWCQRQHGFPKAKWIQGRADRIPAVDASVDVVVNVESSHAYPSMLAFLREVERVLRPGGYFAFCDIRTSEGMIEIERQMDRSGLKRVEQHLITTNVLRALDGVSRQRECQIVVGVPRFFRKAFRDFAGLKDSVLYNLMATDKMHYLCYLLQKPCIA